MKKIWLLLLSVIVLNSCGNMNKTAFGDEKHLDGNFQLVSVQGNDVSSEDFIFEFNTVENNVFGDTGCNGFSANFKQDGSQVSFIAPLSTRKFCEGKMKTEQNILSSLVEVSKFEKVGNEFQFFSEAGERLFILKKIEEE